MQRVSRAFQGELASLTWLCWGRAWGTRGQTHRCTDGWSRHFCPCRHWQFVVVSQVPVPKILRKQKIEFFFANFSKCSKKFCLFRSFENFSSLRSHSIISSRVCVYSGTNTSDFIQCCSFVCKLIPWVTLHAKPWRKCYSDKIQKRVEVSAWKS